MAKLDTKAMESNLESNAALNRCKNGHEQCTGGCQDNSPGQIKRGNVEAVVTLAYPKKLDSMGGSESRGKDNTKRGS